MLVLSARDSVDRRAMRAAAGDAAYVPSSWRMPAELRGRDDVRLYAEALFAEVAAPQLGLALAVPADDWLPGLDRRLLGRTIRATTLEQVRRFPVFLKSVDDKLGEVRGAVYDAPPDAPGETPVLAADPVEMDRELRLFCLDGEVLTGSGYWRDGQEWQVPLEATGIDPRKLIEEAWNDRLPSAVVIDVATVGDELVVVEANGAWGASLYASDAAKALPCVLRATLPGAQEGPTTRRPQLDDE